MTIIEQPADSLGRVIAELTAGTTWLPTCSRADEQDYAATLVRDALVVFDPDDPATVAALADACHVFADVHRQYEQDAAPMAACVTALPRVTRGVLLDDLAALLERRALLDADPQCYVDSYCDLPPRIDRASWADLEAEDLDADIDTACWHVLTGVRDPFDPEYRLFPQAVVEARP